MQTQNGPSFYKCIGRTRRLSDFASPRRKLHDSATCPPPQQSSRTGCAPGFEAQTGKPTCMVVLRPKPPKSSIFTWTPRNLMLTYVRPPPSFWCFHPAWLDWRCLHHVHVLLLFRAPRGSLDSIRSLESFSLSPLMFILHFPWSIGMNLLLDLHRNTVDHHVISYSCT